MKKNPFLRFLSNRPFYRDTGRVFLILCLLVCANQGLARAEEKSPLLLPLTSAKTIYMVFHKVARTDPDFAATVRATDIYKATPHSQQEYLIAKETKKLEYDFADIDPKQEPIVVRSAVTVKVDTVHFPSMDVSLPGSTLPKSAIYFPYSWGGSNIALIPDKIEPLMDIPMSAAEAQAAAAKTGDGTATMVLEMVPLYADGKRAMSLDRIDQWLLMTKIISASYYNQNLQLVWSWHDASYKKAAVSPLQDLKK